MKVRSRKAYSKGQVHRSTLAGESHRDTQKVKAGSKEVNTQMSHMVRLKNAYSQVRQTWTPKKTVTSKEACLLMHHTPEHECEVTHW